MDKETEILIEQQSRLVTKIMSPSLELAEELCKKPSDVKSLASSFALSLFKGFAQKCNDPSIFGKEMMYEINHAIIKAIEEEVGYTHVTKKTMALK